MPWRMAGRLRALPVPSDSAIACIYSALTVPEPPPGLPQECWSVTPARRAAGGPSSRQARHRHCAAHTRTHCHLFTSPLVLAEVLSTTHSKLSQSSHTLHARPAFAPPPAAVPRDRRGAAGHPPGCAAAPPPGQRAPAAAPLHQRQRPPRPAPPHQRRPQGQHHLQDPPQAGIWRGAQAGGQRARAGLLGLRGGARWVLAAAVTAGRAGRRRGGSEGNGGQPIPGAARREGGAAQPQLLLQLPSFRAATRAHACSGGAHPAHMPTLPTPHTLLRPLPPLCSHDLERR